MPVRRDDRADPDDTSAMAAPSRPELARVIVLAGCVVDRRRLVAGGVQHPDMILLGLRRLPEILTQPVNIELHARDPFQGRDHIFLQLFDHILAPVLGDPSVRLIRHMQHRGLAVEALADQLEPLHESEAACVGQQQHVFSKIIIPRNQILGMRKKTFIAGTGKASG